MRKIIEEIRGRCEAFLGQREDLVWVVRAGLSEYMALTSILDSLEKEESPDAFWIFADAFESRGAYVEAVLGSFEARCALMNEKLTEMGEPPLTPTPGEVKDPKQEPIARMRALMVHARNLIPDVEASHLVWGLLPAEIRDPVEFSTFVIELLRHAPPVPWCHHMRVVVRERNDQAMLHQHARSLPRARWYTPDLSNPAVEVALLEEAEDLALPLPQRMQALFVLAGMDMGQRRLGAAVEKYGLLAKYYNSTGEQALCALSLNGLGEIADRNENPALAQKYYESALTPAVESKSVIPLVNITLNLANLHRKQKRWAEAFDHYSAGSELANACCNASLRIACLEQMGFCRHKLGDPKGAWTHWNACKELARGVDAERELFSCLERLRGLFAELGMRTQKSEIEAEIAELKKQGVKAYPA